MRIIIVFFSFCIISMPLFATEANIPSDDYLYLVHFFLGFGSVDNSDLARYSQDFRDYYLANISNSVDSSNDEFTEEFCFGPLGGGLRYIEGYYGIDISGAIQGVRSRFNKITGSNGSADSSLFLEVFSIEPTFLLNFRFFKHHNISYGVGPGLYVASLDEKTNATINSSAYSQEKTYYDKTIGFNSKLEYLFLDNKNAIFTGIMYRYVVFQDFGFRNQYNNNKELNLDIKGLFIYFGFGNAF